ncbi:hypothetical protein D3C76_927330 [compost metagenome]
MRSAIITASSMLWETMRMPLVGILLSSHSSSMSSRSVSPVSTSSAEKASSISSTSGLVTSARAIPTRCFMPPDSSRGSAPPKPARPISSSTASARCSRSAGATPWASRPSSTFCCTVSQGNSAKDWKTMAMPGTGAWIGRPR